MVGTVLALDFLRFARWESPADKLVTMGIMPISHSCVWRHKRQAIREACTPKQTWHRQAGLITSFICLEIFVGFMAVAIFSTVPVAYQEVLELAIMASFIGIAVSWMYRDSFHPGRWEIHRFNLYASTERQLPDSVIHLEHRVRSGMPGVSSEIHRHGTDPFLAIVVRWWIFYRTFYLVEFNDNGIVAN